jgi:hypothetical protein
MDVIPEPELDPVLSGMVSIAPAQTTADDTEVDALKTTVVEGTFQRKYVSVVRSTEIGWDRTCKYDSSNTLSGQKSQEVPTSIPFPLMLCNTSGPIIMAYTSISLRMPLRLSSAYPFRHNEVSATEIPYDRTLHNLVHQDVFQETVNIPHAYCI